MMSGPSPFVVVAPRLVMIARRFVMVALVATAHDFAGPSEVLSTRAGAPV